MSNPNQAMDLICDHDCPITGPCPTSFTKINFCLSEPFPERCKFSFMLTVIACNVIKVACLASILWRHQLNTLLTTGAASASFMDTPYPILRERCLLSRKDVSTSEGQVSAESKVYRITSVCWHYAFSKKRWWRC